ncbi:MAG: ATP-binding protein [Lachnospiraceae bacterium]
MREKKSQSIILFHEKNRNHLIYKMFLMTQDQENMEQLFYEVVRGLLDFAIEYGFSGNIWQCYITNYLVTHENAYSISSENSAEHSESLYEIALTDLQKFREIYFLDLNKKISKKNKHLVSSIIKYKTNNKKSKVYHKTIRDKIIELSNSFEKTLIAEEMLELLTKFYHSYGVGILGLHSAFRIEYEGEVWIKPIHNIARVKFDDLVGYEEQKKKLIDNTRAFINGNPANNCFLFGDAGTGKSSSIKALANEYYKDGLRIIEVYKHQFLELNELIHILKNRNYKFIIYMDDLSFEETEIEYKYLKAIIEGGLEKMPDNIRIYATSNRRHIIKEDFADKEGRRDALHASDTVQEKLSLFARFGVNIFYPSPEKKEYNEIVKVLAKRNNIMIEEEELLLEANRWELTHGGFSGRAANQFIDYLLGK